jgi:hypothetical protein
MSTQREQDIIKHHHGQIMKFMMKTEAPGMDKVSEVTDHIYLSNWKNGCDTMLLREQGIKAVLYLGQAPKNPSVLKAYEKRKIAHLHFPISAEPPTDILPHVMRFNAYIHDHVRNEDRILIHCEDGISSSPAILAIYFINRYYITNFITNLGITKKLVDPESMFTIYIIRFLKEYRPCIVIHPVILYQVLLAEMLMKRQFSAEFQKYRKAKQAEERAERAERARRRKAHQARQAHQAHQARQAESSEEDLPAAPAKRKPGKPVKSIPANEDLSEDLSEDMEAYIHKAVAKAQKPMPRAKPSAKPSKRVSGLAGLAGLANADAGYDTLADLHGIRAPSLPSLPSLPSVPSASRAVAETETENEDTIGSDDLDSENESVEIPYDDLDDEDLDLFGSAEDLEDDLTD